jgi:hypothetical protein
MSISKRRSAALVAKFSLLSYRSLLLVFLLLGGNLIMAKMVIAASPLPGVAIENQATASFLDTGDNTSKTVLSDVVTTTVAEVAGVTVTAAGMTGTPAPGNTVFFNFRITNVGNDATRFFIPGVPSSITNGTAGNITVIEYDPDGSGTTAPTNISSNNTVLTTGSDTGTLTGIPNNGSIPANGTLLVQIPVTIGTTVTGSNVSVTLGNTSPANGQNIVYVNEGNDLYTIDNTGTANGDFTGDPINGDSINHRQEASATQTAPLIILDRSDAPTSYGEVTHSIVSGIQLGAAIDNDTASIANATASGDGTDDDGVTFVGGTTLNTGATASVSVVTSGTGALHAWIDFNGNGTFESSERITNWVGGNSSTGGTTTLTFGVPEGFTGTTYARFRYSSDVAAANPTGSASNGEVEDYQITLAPRLTPATYTNGTPVRKGICSIYSATGADQVVTAPAGARGLTVKLWGAGGGHEIVGTGYAGAGGYTDAQFGSSVVTPGAQFTLVVGRGGMFGGRPNEFSPTAVYGFGAVAGHEQGGGLAGLFTGGSAVLETDQARTLAIAGGGGGYENSGIGTGTTGGNGNSTSSGGQSTMRGSTDNLTRGSSNVIMTAHLSSGGGGYQGGGRQPAPNPYSNITRGEFANIAAASGGSGYVAPYATAGRILSTIDGIGIPPNTSDSDYLTGIGTAGTLGTNPGGNARAVLCWDVSDYGDAPATYDVGTPASHLLSSSPSVYLGAIPPDGESAAQPNVAANGDNTNGTSDEDAFTTLPNVPTTGSYSLNNVPVKNTSVTAATLHSWIDFNKDGVFQSSEYTSVSIPANATTANLNWASIPAGTTAGSTYARFRITTDTLSDDTATTEDERSFGSASDGEVEDYPVMITAPVPVTPSICAATGGTLGANLFTNNGTFGTGTTTPNTSISLPAGRTSYIFKPYASAAPNDGNYAVVNQMTLSTFTGSWHNTVGHTTGTVDDQMMVVNADAVPGTFYTETVTVLPNQNMVFSSWLMNLVTTTASSYAPIKPNISFVINRIGVDDNNDGTIDEPGEGQTITTSGAVPNTANPTWNNYGAIFNTGAATQIQFRFVNNAPGGGGNDLVLDDLMVAPCTLPAGNISGTLYQDINTNNVYNNGTDAKISANVAVNLKSSTGAIIATAYTDADGKYNFTNVPTGSNYSIEVALTDTNISSELRATANPSGANTTGIQTGITVTANTTLDNQNFGFKSKAKLSIVKRITAIKDAETNTTTTFDSFVDDGTTNNLLPGWTVGTGSYLLGALNNGAVKVKPGDEVEYTIYYLNSGDSPISKARVCDRLNKNLAFQTQFSTTTAINQGIEFTKDISTSYPTNTATDNDAGFYSTSSILPINCNLTANTTFDVNNISDNIVVVDVARIANPLLGIISDPLTNGQRGYVKFKVKVQ